jgi:hypothetical protein
VEGDRGGARSHFFFLLILTLSHGLTPRFICQGDHVIYILIKTGPVYMGPNTVGRESIKGVQIVREAEGISFQGPGEDEMKEQQRVDPELAWVVRWRETGEEPTEGELFIGDSRSKYYWINREIFVLEKGVLWRGRPSSRCVHYLSQCEVGA